MPKNPDRPKLKIKRGYVKTRQARRLMTKEAIKARLTAKTEKRYHITPNTVCMALLRARGLMNEAARSLQIPRATLKRYIDSHDDCIETLHAAREAMGDVAEQKLFELIEAGDVRCILYYLSTVHRSRGYGLRIGEDPAAIDAGRGPVFVETVNIVGVPSGTHLPKQIAAKEDMVIDN